MEELKRAHRQAKQDKKRKVNTRTVSVSFLIVCEGKCTEPNYFLALIKDRYSDVREFTIKGKGLGTVSLVKEAIAIRDKSQKEFDRVWVVFDKDDFQDFNEAIALAKKNKINCAWSNESFELWYCLHFQYLDSAISRIGYEEIIEREIKKATGDSTYKYKKNDTDFYSLLQQYGDEEKAIINAERLQEQFTDENYSIHNPCTHVNELVEELKNPDRLLK